MDLVEGVSELMVGPNGRGLVGALLDVVAEVLEDGEDGEGHGRAGGGQLCHEGGVAGFQQARKGLALT